MRSVSSQDGAMRRNAKIEYESTLAPRCVATSVDAKASWNKINASSRDGRVFVATSVDGLELCAVSNPIAGAKGKRTASNRYSASSQDGMLCKRERGWWVGWAFLRFAGARVLRVRTTDSERVPS